MQISRANVVYRELPIRIFIHCASDVPLSRLRVYTRTVLLPCYNGHIIFSRSLRGHRERWGTYAVREQGAEKWTCSQLPTLRSSEFLWWARPRKRVIVLSLTPLRWIERNKKEKNRGTLKQMKLTVNTWLNKKLFSLKALHPKNISSHWIFLFYV